MKKTTIFQIRYQTVHRHLVPLQPKHQIWIPYWMKLMMSLKLMPKNSCRVLSKKVDSNSNQSLRANTELLNGKGPSAFYEHLLSNLHMGLDSEYCVLSVHTHKSRLHTAS